MSEVEKKRVTPHVALAGISRGGRTGGGASQRLSSPSLPSQEQQEDW